MQEFFMRVAREDMLTLFSHTAEITRINVSIFLRNAQVISPDLKYKAACILEILTGQRPTLDDGIDVKDEFLIPEEDLKGENYFKSLRAAMGTSGTRMLLTPDEMKKASDTKGIRLMTDLNRVNIYTFLEKAREFYLPDLASLEVSTEKNVHDNDAALADIAALFKVPMRKTGSGGIRSPPRRRLHHDASEKGAPENGDIENPSVACAAYVLKSTDILKFPDIELYFEPLASVFDYDSTDCLQLYLRPCISVNSAFRRKFPNHFASLQVSNLKIMNYALSLFFNPFSTRSHQ